MPIAREGDNDMPTTALTGKGGALRGLNVKRWLYTEPYFKVVMTWPRRSPISEFLPLIMRGTRDLEKFARACAEAPESTVVLSVKLSAEMLQTCPRSLDYWLEDLNKATDRIARATAGGSSAVTFYREVLEADPPYHFIGVTTGKGRAAPTIDNVIEMDLPPARAAGRITPAQREKPKRKPTKRARSHK